MLRGIIQRDAYDVTTLHPLGLQPTRRVSYQSIKIAVQDGAFAMDECRMHRPVTRIDAKGMGKVHV